MPTSPTPTPLDQPMRDFSLWSAFALAFSDISPIVGIYSVFAISIVAAGPAFFWSLPIVLAGELLVTAVFGELVSKWPLSGSVYAWARQLVGPRFGWPPGMRSGARCAATPSTPQPSARRLDSRQTWHTPSG